MNLEINELKTIAENRQLENTLKRSEKRLHKLASDLIHAQENERKRLAFELHDVLGKSLTAIKFCVENIVVTKKHLDKDTKGQLDTVVTMVQETIRETQEITKNLWPPVLDDLGILATISWYSRQFESTYPWIFIDQRVKITENEIPDLIKIVIFRILQEAMNNSVKHSECKNIRLSLTKISRGIQFIVADDGRGFVPKNTPHPIEARQGVGLLSMKERSRLSGGIFEITSKPESGTLIKVTWPINLIPR